MSGRDELLARIASAIARKPFAFAAAEVLAALETDHVVIDRRQWERVRRLLECAEDWHNAEPDSHDELAAAVKLSYAVDLLEPGDLDDLARDAPAGEG